MDPIWEVGGLRIFSQKISQTSGERESQWELLWLIEPVLEAFEILPANWPGKYFSGQSVGRSCKTTLSPSYTKWFFSCSTCSCLARTTWRFSWRVSGGGTLRGFCAPQLPQKFSANTVISVHKKVAKYRNASIGRVETGCHNATTTLYEKFRPNNTEITLMNL